jgi:ribosomal protein S27E
MTSATAPQPKRRWRPSSGRTVRRLRTFVTVECRECGHSARVGIYLEQADRLRCSRCGAGDPHVGGRSPLEQWAKQRLGR